MRKARNARSNELEDLVSVGPAMRRDFETLGIRTVEQLKDCDAEDLYLKLCGRTGARHDPCVQDVFSAAIAQARDPELPAERKQWWYWSRERKKRGR